jgi:tetratricopeptide (TPR) repeat protein
LKRKIVQVVIDLKWAVGIEHLEQAHESRLESLTGLKEGLRSMEGGPPDLEMVRVLVVLATDAWRIQDPPDWNAAQTYAQAAVEMSERLDSPPDLSRSLGALAYVMDGQSLLRQHLQAAERRLEISQHPGFTDIFEKIEALRNAGAGYMYVGEYQLAIPFLNQAEEMAEQAHVVDQQMNATGLQAQCWFRLDHWDEVLATEEKWRALERRYRRERVGET